MRCGKWHPGLKKRKKKKEKKKEGSNFRHSTRSHHSELLSPGTMEERCTGSLRQYSTVPKSTILFLRTHE